MTDTTYNGWTNRETWLVNTHQRGNTMTEGDIQKAIANRYGQKVTDWSIQKGYHKKLKATDSGLMVRYSTDGFINGRQWLETLQQWAEGHTLFEYDPDLN